MQEMEAYLPAQNTVEAEIEAKELAAIIDAFLDTLSVENRIIFMRRYAYFDTYAEIANRVGLSEKRICPTCPYPPEDEETLDGKEGIRMNTRQFLKR